MADVIASDGVFSQPQQQLLAVLMDMMIPASTDFPSAADPAIFPRTVVALRASEPIVRQGLETLEELAAQTYQCGFATLDAAQRSRLIDDMRSRQPAFIQVLQAHVVGSYYQDDRVLLGLGMPAKSPHPGGYEVAATDWSVLDPVRKRKPFYLHLQTGGGDG